MPVFTFILPLTSVVLKSIDSANNRDIKVIVIYLCIIK
jgi:hypothetical protein